MKIKNTLDRLETGSYKNSRQIVLAGIPFTTRDVLVKAPLLTGLNMFYLGDRGEGKTQLAHDINSYFGESSCYASGRPDFEPSELFRQLNAQALGRILRGEATPEETLQIEQLTKNIAKNLFYVDELNRCPPVTQNYFFDLMDGRIVFQGKMHLLGNRGYSVGFASANSGNSYHGTFEMDAALLERMHMAVDITYPDFFTTSEDVFDIFAGTKKNPRASVPEAESGLVEEILAMHEEFKQRHASPILCVMAPYFNIGLDYVQGTAKHSKRALKKSWPNSQGLRIDTDENKLYPLSKRALFGAIALTSGLEMIIEETSRFPYKENKGGLSNLELSQLEIDLFLDALKFTIPFSQTISSQYIDSQCSGDAYEAYENIFGQNSARRREIREKIPKIYNAMLFAGEGKTNTALLDEVAKDDEFEWQPVREAIIHYANLTEKQISNEQILKEAKVKGEN